MMATLTEVELWIQAVGLWREVYDSDVDDNVAKSEVTGKERILTAEGMDPAKARLQRFCERHGLCPWLHSVLVHGSEYRARSYRFLTTNVGR